LERSAGSLWVKRNRRTQRVRDALRHRHTLVAYWLVLLSARRPIRQARPMRRPSVPWPVAGVAAGAMAVFVALTIVVTSNPSLAADSRAFHIANELRTPALDHAARIVTTLGLLVIVGPVLVIGAALLTHRRRRARAASLLIGAALAWISVWITKVAVDRARPPAPLVHTSGQSYPSGHAANSVGYLALAIALTVAIPSRIGRILAVAAGALLTVLVGLSRIYLRAHYASDVLAGEALATAMYALAAIGTLAWQKRGHSAREAIASPPAGGASAADETRRLANNRRSLRCIPVASLAPSVAGAAPKHGSVRGETGLDPFSTTLGRFRS
jgi:membrane-associated phospholipid phosphatase